jgi:hypothetical protein
MMEATVSLPLQGLPMAVAGRRVRAVDATSVSEPGSTGTDWKVHWAVNLADLQCDFFELTDIRGGGETFRRVPVLTLQRFDHEELTKTSRLVKKFGDRSLTLADAHGLVIIHER